MRKNGELFDGLNEGNEKPSMIARKHSRKLGKALAITEVNLSIRANAESQQRTEALVMARILAMAGLPRTRTEKKQLVRILRLGPDRWIKITYSTVGKELPYGQDRALLAAIQHLALSPTEGIASPIVRFKNAASFLRIFGFADTKYYYDRLRSGFKRLSTMLINIEEGSTKKDLEDADVGENLLVIRNYRLPSRKDVQSEVAGQLSLAPIYEEDGAIYGVKLDEEFFRLLTNQLKQVIVPIELLKLYTDSPAKWDFALFLLSRAAFPFCRSRSKIDHETLVGLFRDGKERERDVIKRLQGYLREFHIATDNRVKAKIVEDGFVPKQPGQRGPRSKLWSMVVEPGLPLVWSGKTNRFIEEPMATYFQTKEEELAYLKLKKSFPKGLAPSDLAKGKEWPKIALANLVYLGLAKELAGVFFLNK